MDDKFFDLKKEKQDRILNGALKIFALNGYKNGSTDVIVKEAGISKGLLFHYFGTKQELYRFLRDYSIRFLQLEIRSNVSASETDYFTIWRQIIASEESIMDQYPYMIAFLESAETETDPDTFEPEDEKKKSRDVYSKALQNADFVHINPEVDIKAIEEMLHFTRNNVQRKLMFKDMMDAGIYVQQVSHYFDMMAKLTYV
ncbi:MULTISPECIES: TetR/AcrR family transcriptional regulator [Butyrivibrio]|jgi:AcrR family transcriptional regulator|uniref:Transcriptional regulator, TetR family n=1 Tax=Butyrivibrio fibrisolvens TaxID=831 RepID=A0A1H9W107_BUTFI|nr:MULTISPECIES: TetR/AcrR family transcriptional regulator [Butyrivibrio]SEQ11365.1 transcriptional regulator, TetR family [Butyrivibrio sp. TB]SES27572.1 transcriptional regulator, TetR family [Butyrivibrio fibrisolvens]